MGTKRKGGTEKRRVARAHIQRPTDSGKDFKDLEADIAASGGDGKKLGITRLSVERSKIAFAERVFQWRESSVRTQRGRDAHIQTMTAVLLESKHPLPALLVKPVGEMLYVIDGHHRLAAYDNARWTKNIPVEVFEGTLREARVRALGSNSKDKLPMSFEEKLEAAWRITKEGGWGLSAKETAEAAGVSRRSVFRMRAVWKALKDRVTADGAEAVERLTWVMAQRLEKGIEEDDDWDWENWKLEKAKELVDKWNKHDITPLMLKDPEILVTHIFRNAFASEPSTISSTT